MHLDMKRVLMLWVLVVLSVFGVQAQIPAEVTEVMTRCQTAMDNPNGLEYTMDMKVAIGPVTLTNSQRVIGGKGEKHRTSMTMKIVGMEVTIESGYDGKETWVMNRVTDKDTVRISKGNKMKSDDGVDLDMAKDFKKAKMKLKNGYYEIEYSDPIDKSSEVKRIVFKVSAKNYYLQEMRTSAKGAKVTMTITRIKVGLKDDYFKLDLSKYPNAVVVRE